MHSSRIRTARSLTDHISWCQAGLCGGMHATHAPRACMPPLAMLSPLPMPRMPPSHACPPPTGHAYPLPHMPPGHAHPQPCTPPPAMHAPLPCMPPPHGQNSCHTLLKILPCPKLRLREVIKSHFYFFKIDHSNFILITLF